MEKVKVVIAGPRGRMGSEAVQLVNRIENYEIAAVIDHKNGGAILAILKDSHNLAKFRYTQILLCAFRN